MTMLNGVVSKKGIRLSLLVALTVLLVTGVSRAQTAAPDQITASDIAGKMPRSIEVHPAANKAGVATLGTTITSSANSGIPGIDSVSNFSGQYSVLGVGPTGQAQDTWFFNTLGKPPEMGGTTIFNAPIVPVTVDLRNDDGSARFVRVVNRRAFTCGTPSEPGCQPLISDPARFIDPVLNSPVFSNTNYTSSSVPTQFTDAVARAEYQNATADWHTMLAPSLKTPRTMVINQDPTCGRKKGHCNYEFALNGDGSCCLFVLVDFNLFGNLLFPPTFPFDSTDLATPIGGAEAAGDITTKDVSTFLFPNVFLFFNGIPSECCVIGFHTFDFEPGVQSNGNLPRFYVVNYSSWITPGLFNGGFQDVTALSHEMAEIFNDPFVAFDGVHDITPWWLSGGHCQDNLEVGDVIEALPDAVFPITMNGLTYHPQNEALLQWFEFQSPSSALNGAYSYPDITTLTKLSAPQPFRCGLP